MSETHNPSALEAFMALGLNPPEQVPDTPAPVPPPPPAEATPQAATPVEASAVPPAGAPVTAVTSFTQAQPVQTADQSTVTATVTPSTPQAPATPPAAAAPAMTTSPATAPATVEQPAEPAHTVAPQPTPAPQMPNLSDIPVIPPVKDAGAGQLVFGSVEPIAAAPPVISEPDDQEELLKRAQQQKDQKMIEPLAVQNPFFKYEGIEDEITEDCTPEDLRKKYEADFPDLDEKKVSWSLSYLGITQTLTSTASIFTAKKELEGTPRFLDALRKNKQKETPRCYVTPSVRARSKGEGLPAYKAYCFTEADAIASQKPIAILASCNGRLYQRRINQIGEFTAPADFLPELPLVCPGFRMRLPKIPYSILESIVAFFRDVAGEHGFEALAQIYYEPETGYYRIHIPEQTVSHVSVNFDTELPDENLIYVMDIHSHNSMPAFFSAVDNADEKGTRLYAVVGRLNRITPTMKVRASCAGEYIPLWPEDVFAMPSANQYPEQWKEKLGAPKPEGGRLN